MHRNEIEEIASKDALIAVPARRDFRNTRTETKIYTNVVWEKQEVCSVASMKEIRKGLLDYCKQKRDYATIQNSRGIQRSYVRTIRRSHSTDSYSLIHTFTIWYFTSTDNTIKVHSNQLTNATRWKAVDSNCLSVLKIRILTCGNLCFIIKMMLDLGGQCLLLTTLPERVA